MRGIKAIRLLRLLLERNYRRHHLDKRPCLLSWPPCPFFSFSFFPFVFLEPRWSDTIAGSVSVMHFRLTAEPLGKPLPPSSVSTHSRVRARPVLAGPFIYHIHIRM